MNNPEDISYDLIFTCLHKYYELDDWKRFLNNFVIDESYELNKDVKYSEDIFNYISKPI